MKNLFQTLIAYLLITSIATAQSDIQLSINQDARLALLGDDKGNNAFTPNLLIRVDLQDNQRTHGFYVIGIEYEYADLRGGAYNRYAMTAGYTFNKLRLDNLDLTGLLSYSGIVRTRVSEFRAVTSVHSGVSGSVSIAYRIPNTRFKIQAVNQLIQRTDKESKYGDGARYTFNAIGVDYSFFVGVAYQFETKKRR